MACRSSEESDVLRCPLQHHVWDQTKPEPNHKIRVVTIVTKLVIVPMVILVRVEIISDSSNQ